MRPSPAALFVISFRQRADNTPAARTARFAGAIPRINISSHFNGDSAQRLIIMQGRRHFAELSTC
jgi:hypothetical protein